MLKFPMHWERKKFKGQRKNFGREVVNDWATLTRLALLFLSHPFASISQDGESSPVSRRGKQSDASLRRMDGLMFRWQSLMDPGSLSSPCCWQRPLLLKGHNRPLTSVKYNVDGDLLFTCGKDGVCSVWWSHNGIRLGTYDGHEGAIWDSSVDHSTERLLTGLSSAPSYPSCAVWRVEDRPEIHPRSFLSLPVGPSVVSVLRLQRARIEL